MVNLKIWYLFSLIAGLDILRAINSTYIDFDIALIFVSVICSIVGSSTQIVHKNLQKTILKKEIAAIYVSGFMISILSYGVGVYTGRLFWGAVSSVFASFMSLELLNGLRTVALEVVSILPDAFKQYLRFKYDKKNKDNNDNNDSIN